MLLRNMCYAHVAPRHSLRLCRSATLLRSVAPRHYFVGSEATLRSTAKQCFVPQHCFAVHANLFHKFAVQIWGLLRNPMGFAHLQGFALPAKLIVRLLTVAGGSRSSNPLLLTAASATNGASPLAEGLRPSAPFGGIHPFEGATAAG